MGMLGTNIGGGALKAANNLSDVSSAATTRTNLGVTATGADTTYNFRANNLSDVASIYTTAKNLQSSYVVAQSGVAVAHPNDTNAFQFVSISLPALSANDQIEIVVEFSKTGTAGTFTPSIKLGNTVIMGGSAVSAASLYARGVQYVANKNATNSQVFAGAAYAFNPVIGASATAAGSGSEETNAGIALTISATTASAADTLTLSRYHVKISPKA